MKKLFVIDGNSLLFRAYYATSYGGGAVMSTKSGIPTNAIFAFGNMLTKLLSSFKGAESIFIGFDADSHTFRKEEYKDYKANRKPCPEDLKKQFPISRELCKALGIICYEEHGIEADDICGTVAKMGSKAGYEVEVFTSDKDYLQLIDSHISVSLLKVGLSNMDLVTKENMKEKYGFDPLQIIDYKGLRGDSSDNLPGIPGIGDKTAVKLIQDYGSFAKILEVAPSQKGKAWQNIVTYAEQGKQCYELATILTNVKLPFSLEELEYKGYSFSEVSAFANKYELKQLLFRLPQNLKAQEKSNSEIVSKQVTSLEGISFGKKIGVALDMDYSSYHDGEVYGIAFANEEGSYYETLDVFLKDPLAKKMLEDPDISKDIYDGKASIYALSLLGVSLKGIQNDLLLAAYLQDSSLNSNPNLVYSSFGVDISSEEEEISLFSKGQMKSCMKMAYFALSLEEKAIKNLKSVDAYSLYTDVEMPLMKVLAKMELEGFPIHKEVLEDFKGSFEKKKKEYQEKIYSLAGKEFNINSSKQVADVLYKDLALPDTKKGSTSVEALTELENLHPIIPMILNYRKYAKLLSTYIDGLVPYIKEDKKIHSYFNQAQTSTGRLSSSSPNLQNISARDEEGRQIRKAFYYDDPNILLLSLDYHQIELRILAALSSCQAYIDVFNNNHDVHTETAKKIFHVDGVTPALRRQAKAINFAIIYGTTVFGLAQQIGSTFEEAKQVINNFYQSYPEVGTYLNQIIHDAETKGYVTTMFGRRRYLREINDPNFVKREAARRAALNAPVQGSAADLIKIAMVRIDQFLEEKQLKSKMVLQIHDELIFAVPKEELDFMKENISKIMTSAVSLPVKLTVEAGIGHSWYDAKD